MSAEVMFMWKGTTVNLKLARSCVRFLSEQHGRLSEVGPTQCLRDILDWFQHCDPAKDESFRALEEKHGASADFDNVCSFLREYEYETLKRAYPKQCGSLWMAVRGVLRRMNQSRNTSPESTMTSSGDSMKAGGSRSPTNAIKNIREGADTMAFELLMLLSNPETLRLDRDNREHLEHAEQTLATAVEDVRLILRRFKSSDMDTDVKMESPFDDDENNGSNSDYGRGGLGTPDSNYPTSPSGSSSGDSSHHNFASGNGGGRGGFTWFTNNLSQRLSDVSIQSPRSDAKVERSNPAEGNGAKSAPRRVSLRNRASKRISMGIQEMKRMSTKSNKSKRASLCAPNAFVSPSSQI